MATLLPIEERLNLAAQLVKRARIFYDIWWYYEGEDTRPNILKTMNGYSEFFRFDTHAHFVSLVIHLGSLFENRTGTVNFHALIDEAESNGIGRDALDKARTLIADVFTVASKVAILRSNLFAHRSATLSYAAAFEKAEIKPNQLRDLTVVGLKIANTLLVARGLDEHFFHELSRPHLERLINDLAKTS